MYLKNSRRLFWLFALVLLPASGAELKVELLTLDANKRPTLRITGPATGTYILEASRDLQKWWPVGDTVSKNGVLEVTHQSAADNKALWFRGRGVTLAPDVVARHDTNWAASVLVTTNGGTVNLLHPSGYYAVLTVPPFAVIEPVVVTMTAVTNLDGYPFANPCTAALKFEPDGLRFLSPALLEFHFPTNITAEFASLGFQAEGKQLRLVPDDIGSNYINIPVSHFSGIAVGRLSRDEVLAAREKHVTDIFDRASQEPAALKLEERRKALQGEPGSPDLFDKLKVIYRDFFENQVKQLIDESLGDCDMFRALSPRVLALAQELAFMGAEEDAEMVWDFLMGYRRCTAYSVCHAKILQECAAGLRSFEAVRELRGIERQRQLLGAADGENDCGTALTEEMLEQCTPQLWTGTFSYIEEGSTNIYTQKTDGGWVNIDREYYYEISGLVRTTKTSSSRVEMEIPVNLYGQFRSTRTVTGLDSLGEGCPDVQVYGYTSISAAAQGTNNIQLTIFYDQIFGTNISFGGYNGSLPALQAVQRELRVSEGPTCKYYPEVDPNTSSSNTGLTQFAGAYLLKGPGGTLLVPPGSVTQDTVDVTIIGERVINEVPVKSIFRLVVHRAK